MNDLPQALAELHQEAFETPRPWTVAEFDRLLRDPKTVLCGDGHGFALGRLVLDEAELLTIAVPKARRRLGYGAELLTEFLDIMARRGGRVCFLEVAETNLAAFALYQRFDFQVCGRRKSYYVQPDGTTIDAVVMTRAIAGR